MHLRASAGVETQSLPCGKALLSDLTARSVDVDQVSRGLMASLSDVESPPGLVAVLELQPFRVPASPDFVLIPDQIRDPGNLGTLLRSAAAAGVQQVLLPPDTTDAFAPKVVRAGMGAHFRLPIANLEWDEIRSQTRELQVYLADMGGRSCWETDLRQPLALIIGGEAEGASQAARALAGSSLRIPMRPQAESLNAAVAGSVLMFEISRQRNSQN